MSKKVEQQNMFGTSRMQMDESIRLSIESLKEYGPRYDHWAIAWSGGKDSSTLVTFCGFVSVCPLHNA